MAETGGAGMMLQPMVATQPTIDWVLLGLTIWLVGAAVFLTKRYALYFAMRRELMRGSAVVGVRGRVRLIESPATASPVAFGVFDKVIALPEGFMAQTEETRRDLALEHELAHHRARDLLANAIVQPLFALHWFNPLGWVGWRAMRRDQEAACDARVVERCDARLRETYASTIASFATRSDRRASLALAAPMACPVLGDKSIIHRLRSLTMSDVSPRRRIAARVLTIGALAALPLTASISYAETAMGKEVPEAPEPPAAPAAPTAPEAPVAPEAPLAPVAPAAPDHVLTIRDEAGGESRTIEVERKVVTDDAGRSTEHTSYKINGREATPEERAKLEVEVRKLSAKAEKSERAAREMEIKAERMARKAEKQREISVQRELSVARSEMRRDLADARREINATTELDKDTRLALVQMVDSLSDMRFDCDGSSQARAANGGGMGSCISGALASARSAIVQARVSIERDRTLSASERAEALRDLDEAMRELSAVN